MFQNFYAESLSEVAQLLLVNAVHFQNEWKYEFDVSKTKLHAFHTPTGQVEVPMMHMQSRFNMAYLDDIACQVLELPYVVSDRAEKSSFADEVFS